MQVKLGVRRCRHALLVAAAVFAAAVLRCGVPSLVFIFGGRVLAPSRLLHRRAVLLRSSAPSAGDEAAGKFYQLGGETSNADVVPAERFGPFGVVVGGWTEDELEYVVAPALEEAAFPAGEESTEQVSAAQVPIRVLAREDLGRPLEEVLDTIQSMDAVLPDEGEDAALEQPLLLFSGWDPEKMLTSVRRFRSMVALRQLRKEPVAAMVVPRAMRKPVRQLVAEIEGDFLANKGVSAAAS